MPLPPKRRGDKPPPDAQTAALRFLTRREHSARELRRKLASRGVDETAARATVEKLTGLGLQSNARYAEQLIRTRIAQGYGPLRVEVELGQAGLSSDEVEAALAAADCDWDALAAQAHAKKFGRRPASAPERVKQYRFLTGRGFSADQIRSALKAELPEE